MANFNWTFLHSDPKPYCSEQVISSFKDQEKEDAKDADNNFILDDNSRYFINLICYQNLCC